MNWFSTIFIIFFTIPAWAGYYEDLGVPRNASREQIVSAFRKLAMKCHPDKNPKTRDTAEARFKVINEAYEVLKDDVKREKYDRGELKSNEGTQTQSEVQRAWAKFENERKDSLLKQYPEYRRYIEDPFKIFGTIPDPAGLKMIKTLIDTDDALLHGMCAVAIMTSHPGWADHFDLVLKLISAGHALDTLGEFVYAPWWMNEKGAVILKAAIDAGYSLSVARSLGLAGGMPFSIDGKYVTGVSWFQTPYGRPLLEEMILRGMDSRLNMHVFGDRATIYGFTGDHNSTRFDGAILEELRRLGLKLDGRDINANNIKAEMEAKRLKVVRKGDIRISSEHVQQLIGSATALRIDAKPTCADEVQVPQVKGRSRVK